MNSSKATRLLARQVVRFIEAHPEVHDQSSWLIEGEDNSLCGTTMCVAGTAAWLVNGCDYKSTKDAVSQHGSWESYGAELLGLSTREAERIFYEDNETALRRLKKVAKGKEI